LNLVGAVPNTTHTQRSARRSTGELEPKGFDRMTNGELEGLVASELSSVVERARVVSRDGFWVMLRGRERRDVREILLAVRASDRLDGKTTERVMEAAASCRTMDQPVVLAPRQIGCGAGLLWITYRPERGELLSDEFGEGCLPSVALGWAFMEHVVGPLQALHEAGLVHGALTTSSFHCGRDGTVRILSPGVDAHILRASLAMGIGTEAVAYASPEVRAGRPPVAASDQYSLAAILVRLLTGTFPGPRGEIPEGRIPPAWLEGLRRALEGDPARRFDGVADLWGAVGRLRAHGLEPPPKAVRDSPGLATGAPRRSVYVPSAFRPKKGMRDRLEHGAAEGAPGDAGEVLFPDDRWYEERLDFDATPDPSVSPRRRTAGALLLLVLFGAVGLLYRRDPEAVATQMRTAAQLGRELLAEGRPPSVGRGAEGSPEAPLARTPISEQLAGEAGGAEPPGRDATDAAVPEPIETEEPGRAPVPPPSPARPAAPEGPAARPRAPDAQAPQPTSRAMERSQVAPLVESAPAPPGSVSIQTVPWAVIYIDGHYAGTSPVLDVSIPAGTHTLRAERVGYQPYEQDLTVQAGEAVRVTGVVLTGIGR
jgi:hypothetical protein